VLIRAAALEGRARPHHHHNRRGAAAASSRQEEEQRGRRAGAATALALLPRVVVDIDPELAAVAAIACRARCMIAAAACRLMGAACGRTLVLASWGSLIGGGSLID